MAASLISMQKRISYALAAAHRAVHVSLTERLKKHGVQIEAWRIMETLSEGQKHTMGGLAQLGLINPPTLSKLVDRMVSDGLVHRRVADGDHRQINLHLTDLGRKRMIQIRADVEEQDHELSSQLGLREADELVDLLNAVTAGHAS
jgi:DNA-binding MarR family transcriptional regulator